MRTKVYGIIYSGTHVYVPIKWANADFCPNLPNIFGGGVNHDEDYFDALSRELREESQGNMILKDEAKREWGLKYRNGSEDYCFYGIKEENVIFNTIDFNPGKSPGVEVFMLETGGRPIEELEFQAILKIELKFPYEGDRINLEADNLIDISVAEGFKIIDQRHVEQFKKSFSFLAYETFFKNIAYKK